MTEKRIQFRATPKLLMDLDTVARHYQLTRSAAIRFLITEAANHIRWDYKDMDLTQVLLEDARSAEDQGGGTTTPPLGVQ